MALQVADVTLSIAVDGHAALESDGNLEAAAERQRATNCNTIRSDLLRRHHQVSLQDTIKILLHQAVHNTDVADDVAVREESPLCVCVAQPVTRLAVAQDPGGC